ncbi:MAG: serine/threonine protein kinase [Elainella sp. Prado103]|nr:serine/threonine protein kinase [Elainella sp. Prado103]
MAYLPSTELKRSRYRILGLIGQGQFGQVFCAAHRQTGRLVALKNLEQTRFSTHQFLRELRFLLSLQHPNIVTCQSLEHTATGRYLVMDYCEGGTLRTLMSEESRLTLSQSLQLVMDVLAGLDHAHGRGIVHCDIKPENILLHVHGTGWTARISDFGIARLLQEKMQREGDHEGDTGSPAYMAPERFYGQYSAASDIYSIGILFFELMAGYRPFSGTPAELRSAHLNLPLRLPAVIPPAWQPILTQALQKLPARRFRSAREMWVAMRTVAEAEQLGGNDPSPLFLTLVAPPECRFQPLRQVALPHPLGMIAAQPVPQAGFDLRTAAYQVYGIAVPASELTAYGQAWAKKTLFAENSIGEPREQRWQLPGAWGQVQQLLPDEQGCWVVGQRSILRLSSVARSGDSTSVLNPEAESQLVHARMEWAEPHLVAIEPHRQWFAALTGTPEPRMSKLTVGSLNLQPIDRLQPTQTQPTQTQPTQTTWQLNLPLDLQLPAHLMQLIALDSRHLALLLSQVRVDEPPNSTIHFLTRRGNYLGMICLNMPLQQVVMAKTAYQLLAIDHQPGSVLRIDLKPYRIKRFWVEISPQFLAATDWGYVLGSTTGEIVFLDQEGRMIGKLLSPHPLTAMTVVDHGLLLATVDGSAGQLLSFDLRTIGLDLVF